MTPPPSPTDSNPVPSVRFRDVSCRYPGAERPVFGGLSLRLDRPGFHALFGPSGVGKTSLARLIAGDLLPDEGAVERLAPERIAYTYNQERLPGWSPVGRHLDRVSPPGTDDLRQELESVFDVGPVLDRRFSRLSLGQKNRVNLLRYLLQDFGFLVLDESLANVDEPTRERILVHVKRRFPDVIFLYISHNVAEVARFCQDIHVLSARRTPALTTVSGLDALSTEHLDPRELDRVMLEIMNAR